MATLGELVVWGSNEQQQIQQRPGTFLAIAAGGNGQSLAIKADGTLDLWGNPPSGPTLPAALAATAFIDAALGLSMFVAIRADNHEMEVAGVFTPGGGGSSTTADLPPAMKHRKASGVAAGGGFAVFIDETDQKLYQWPLPVPLAPPSGKFSRIRARHGYTIGLNLAGDLFGWGLPFPATPSTLAVPFLQGRVSDPAFNSAEPVSPRAYEHNWNRDSDGYCFVQGPFIDLAAGAREVSGDPNSLPHFLALRADGSVVGWGANTYGQTRPPDGVRFAAVTAGRRCSIGIDTKGRLHLWGLPEEHGVWSAALSTLPTGPFASVGLALNHAAAVGGVPQKGVQAVKVVKLASDG